LYADLSSKGKASLIDALKVGAFIEEYDIADLERLIAATENETIKRVYGNLLRGSKFHIKAFTNVLKVYGETYTPTIISQEEYETILNEETNKGDDNSTTGTVVSGTGTCDGTGPNV
jgi:tRNA isopentenyl-2-thiomethyl-A-37 hydroxylase MiaE